MQEEEKERLHQQLKDALTAIKKLKSGLLEEKSKKFEPIAIIGMAMRLPGGIYTSQDYWKLLSNGVDAITDIPESRFDAKSLYDEQYDTPGKMIVKQGGFLDNIDQFDGSFFDLSYAEIESMDPQQRILLEVTYEALENAGIPLQSLTDSNTGVFIGVTNNDYQKRHFRSGDYTLINPYSYTGSAICSNSGRISYLMGLQGPSVSLDTACSSSLVATHLAVQSLRNQECNLAIAGAANVIIDPEFTIYFSSLNSLSKDSRCKSFSNEANGFIRSEGSGIFILKRLKDAQRDGDNILAVIKGSAVNQDGRSNGFTAPNVKAQERLLKKALENAQLQPEQVAFIEAHGTGTKIGDPIEMEAISAVFSSSKTKEHPLYVGSVKTNIGHTEGVAGMAGMIKSVLAIQNQSIPKNLHFVTPNELIDWKNIPISVPTQNINWNPTNQYIGVSGFGVTGTNAHVLIGESPKIEPQKPSEPLRNDIFILPLSAKTPEALQSLSKAYAQFIKISPDSLEDICAMAALKRTIFDVREVFVAKDKPSMIEQLEDFADIVFEDHKIFDADDYAKVVFVCPGQGAQWIGMAQELYQSEPVFKDSIDKCSQAFSKYVQWSLLEELNGQNFDAIDIIQPVLIAIEIALGQLWKSKGIQPDIVVGHSMGEVAAAFLADMITLDEAANIICTRSLLMKQTSGKGAMAVTDLTLEEAHSKLQNKENYLSIAVQNSPNSTVIAGDPLYLQNLLDELEAEGRFCRLIKVDVASHSPQMDEILSPLTNALKGLQPSNSNIQFFSTALKEKMKGEQLSADYWAKNLRNPVQFGAVIREIVQHDKAVFIELTPHPVLSTAIQDNIQYINKSGVAIPSLWREKDELLSFYKSLGKYFESGLKIDWEKIYPSIHQFVLLPNYPWQKERFWFDQKPQITNMSTENIVENQTIATSNSKDTSLSLTQKKHSSLIYETIWEEVDVQNTSLPKSVLIIKDLEGLGESVATLLIQQGVEVEIISSTEKPISIPEAIIHLSCTNSKATQQDAIFSFRDLIQHYNQKGKAPQLYAITKNGQIISEFDKSIHIPSTALWGLIRTIRNEFPELKSITIDINSNTSAEEIIQVLNQNPAHKEWVHRQQKWYTPLLQEVKSAPQQAIPFNGQVTYLITGGTSGLGLEFANWLASKGVKNIALVSRKGMKPETQPVVDKLRKQGVKVEVFSADITYPDSLAKLVMEIETIMPAIKGIVHAAGVLDDGAFLNLTVEQFNKVLSPKINGGWNLHQYFSNRTLESFVLFSSGASVLGTAGQANYTAANMALDQLANYRKSQGLAALSINFGNIGEIGLAAADIKRGERLAEQGMFIIQPEQLPEYFENLFDMPGAQYMLMDIDFNQWAASNSGITNNTFFSKVLKNTPQKSDLLPSEAIIKYTNKTSAIRYYKSKIKEFVSLITKIPSSKIKEDATFKSMGIDSLMAVQLKNKLQEEAGIDLSVSSIWTYPTIEKYTEYLSENLSYDSESQVSEAPSETFEFANRASAIRHFKNTIKNHLSSITKIPSTKIKEDATFKSMGVDSLMAVQLKNKFQSDFEINIAVSSIWTYPTVEKYAAFVADEKNIIDSPTMEETSSSTSASLPKGAFTDPISKDEIENQVNQMSLDDLLKALDDE
ncbi:MAG: type I polyketide synthase [Chitinophagales bacterium]|nr:type I polyketide synthase [Chitinophagales bacterium]MCZ2394265.1 type I polyketide synthase [Chitinophagales bacterium]